MAKAPWYKRYASDFVSDPYVQAMTAEQYGWYSAMLDMSWIHTPIGRLPNDLSLICKMVGRCDEMYFVQHSKIVVDRFKVSECGQWLYHPRMSEQAERIAQISENKSHKGKAGRKPKPRREPRAINSDVKSNDFQLITDSESDKKAFVLPTWIPKEAWDSYEVMRKKIRKSMTDKARELAVKTLERLSQNGNDPEQVLNQSILNSWQGLFPVKDVQHGNNKPDVFDQIRRAREASQLV